VRKIARHLHIGRRTIANISPRRRRPPLPVSAPANWILQARHRRVSRAGCSCPCHGDRTATRPLGFSGGLSILKEYLHRVRAQASAKRAYVRMEPGPGERFEVDWGHFDALSIGACTKTLRLLSSGMSQPQAVSGVHPQPELRDFCSLSSPCVPLHGRHRTRTVVR